MNKRKLKNLLKNLIVYLPIVIGLLILPFLESYITTPFHEAGHIENAKKFGINMTYTPKFNYYNFNDKSLGDAVLLTQNDVDAYYNLSIYEKSQILLGGIKSDIQFMQILIFLILIFSVLSFELKSRLLLYINVILIIWLIGLINTTMSNIFGGYGSDVYSLVNNVTFIPKQ